MKKEKKLKFREDLALEITEYSGKEPFIDIFGNERIRILKKQFISNGEYSIGSINNPNKKIINFKWVSK